MDFRRDGFAPEFDTVGLDQGKAIGMITDLPIFHARKLPSDGDQTTWLVNFRVNKITEFGAETATRLIVVGVWLAGTPQRAVQNFQRGVLSTIDHADDPATQHDGLVLILVGAGL